MTPVRQYSAALLERFTRSPHCSCSFRVMLPLLMRYLVKARVKSGREHDLVRAVDDGTLGHGSIAGDEYLHDMKQARVNDYAVATWVETCFCDPPLAEERPYWEQYFELVSVRDAHSRRNCRHENGTEPWACCDCDCTQKLEQRLATQGKAFLRELKRAAA
jgi:hypothetical protein